MNLLIIGAPGAGKGTMSNMIVETYGVTHVSTGDMLRHEIKVQSEIGKAAKEYIDKGGLVPDSIIEDIIKERLSKDDIEKGFLFDGYPRTVNQAISLDKILKDLDYTGSDVAVMVNGSGATPLMELCIVNNRVADRLKEKGINVYKTFVGNYMTSLEMAGFSLSLLKLDDEMKNLLDKKADTIAFKEF